MRRTQIQLDEETYALLRRQAYQRGRSISSLVREALDRVLGRAPQKPRADGKHFAFIGAGRSRQAGRAPISERHDRALVEALTSKRER